MGPFGSNLKVDNFIAQGVPVIRGANLNVGGLKDEYFVFVSEEKANSLKRSLAYPDDLVFTHRGTIGQVAIIPHGQYPKYLVSQSQMRLRVKKESLEPMFLYYFFKSPNGQYELLKNSSQVGVPAIASPTQALKDVEIIVPPSPIQRRIVAILSSLDDKIELNRQTNTTLEAIAQAIFKEWFVDFRFPSATGEMQDSELGPIPKGWYIGKLGDILEVKGGTTPSTKEEKYWDGEYQWATPKDLSNLSSPILLKTERKITKEGVAQISSGTLPKGTLLLSSRAPIGYLAIADIPVSINQGFIAINAKKGSNLYILHWLKKNMENVVNRANGSTFLEISKTSFKEIDLIIPTFQVIESFDKMVFPIFEQIIANEYESEALKQIRDGLLPLLMSGEIVV
jgi:type I restriction enzyme S subunit